MSVMELILSKLFPSVHYKQKKLANAYDAFEKTHEELMSSMHELNRELEKTIAEHLEKALGRTPH